MDPVIWLIFFCWVATNWTLCNAAGWFVDAWFWLFFIATVIYFCCCDWALLIEWEKKYISRNLSYIINLYKGMGDATICGNYRGLKLLEVIIKIVVHILEKIIHDHIIDDMVTWTLYQGCNLFTLCYSLKFLLFILPIYVIVINLLCSNLD